MNIENLRNMQYLAMEHNLKTATSFLKIFPVQDLKTYRDGGTGWTVTEVLGHLRDFEVLLLERLTLTVTQDKPDLPFPNPADWAVERRYNEDDPAQTLASWKENRARVLSFFKERPETDWERLAMHPVRGPLTLTDLLLITPQHDSLHFEQLTRILAEKK
jgi:hypothetical protein